MIRTIVKWLGFFLFVPFFLLLLPFIALGIGIAFTGATISGIFQRARWLRDLRRKSRAIPAAEAFDVAVSGTLIVDRPGFNLQGTQCWWTDENVVEQSPVPIPSDDERLELCKQNNEMGAHEFDLWCWRRYISPDTGSAILVTPPTHGEAMATRIREHQPALECVKVWSAIAAMQSVAPHGSEQSDEPEPE